MPRFCANISLLFTEVAFPERFAAAARAGFRAVEMQFPYAHDSGLLAERIGLGAAIAMFGFGAYVVMILALLTLPETLGRPLDSVVPAEGAA